MKEGWIKNDEGWRMKNDDLNEICKWRVAFTTEKSAFETQLSIGA